MAVWDEGYVSDLTYTYGYYGELNPLRTQLAFLAAGLEPPKVATACELGFGQGMSVNLHAASGTTSWHGTDFNPTQAVFARRVAQAGGTDAQLFDQSFADFCQREDLPEFDFIGLHGIWSWISDENRKWIVHLIDRKLRLGGVVYISYNTLPGWASNAPIRHLLVEHDRVLGQRGQGMHENVGAALDFVGKVFEAKPSVMRNAPGMGERFKQISGQNRNYLAHEYFNRDWKPIYFREMAGWMEEAKLSWACSAHLLDHIDSINMTADQRKVVGEIRDPLLREGVRDFMTSNQFRRDYWVKGATRQHISETNAGLGKMRVLMTVPRSETTLTVSGPIGEANLSEPIYTPIFDLMADHKIRSLAEMEVELRKNNITAGQLREAVILLVGRGTLSIVQDDQTVSKARKTAQSLNQFIMQKAKHSHELANLASPVTGGGVVVRRFHQLFLMAMREGKKQPELAQAIWSILKSNNERLVKDGNPLDGDEANLAELSSQVDAFATVHLPIYKALQLV